MRHEQPPALQATRFRRHTRAFLKIQDGCDARCSYCIVPLARGRSRSTIPSRVLTSLKGLKETGYQPFKTILFAAYCGEGYENGHYTPDLEADGVLQAAPGFSTVYEVEAVIRLRGLGSDGDRLTLNATGNLRLLKAFQEAARRVGVRTLTVEDAIDIAVIYDGKSMNDVGQDAPQITLSWQGWENTAKTAQDTVGTLSSRQLERAGRTLALALMTLARETY